MTVIADPPVAAPRSATLANPVATNPLAVGASIFMLLPAVVVFLDGPAIPVARVALLVSVVLGSMALGQIKVSGEGGRVLATIAVVISGSWLTVASLARMYSVIVGDFVVHWAQIVN